MRESLQELSNVITVNAVKEACCPSGYAVRSVPNGYGLTHHDPAIQTPD